MNQLSVRDGFTFGCGFFLAAFVAWLVVVIAIGILTAVFGTLFGGILERFNFLGPVSQLLGFI